MSWLQKLLPRASAPKAQRAGARRPVGQVPGCDAVLYSPSSSATTSARSATTTAQVSARERLESCSTKGGIELGAELVPVDALKFKDSKRYKDRLIAAQKETGETDALMVMQGSIKGLPVVVAPFEFKFMGGSMGSVVGERFMGGVHVASRTGSLGCFAQPAARACRKAFSR